MSKMKEKRKFIRLTVSLDVLHGLLGSIPLKIKSHVKNLTREGVRICSEKVLPKNSYVGLKIGIPGNDNPITLFVKVMWSKKTGKSCYETGMRFVKMKDSDKARLLDYAYNEWKESTAP